MPPHISVPTARHRSPSRIFLAPHAASRVARPMSPHSLNIHRNRSNPEKWEQRLTRARATYTYRVPLISTSPLLPSTQTLLPPNLDRDLRATQPSLCLPRTFWQNLPTSANLDTQSPRSRQPSASSQQPQAQASATRPPLPPAAPQRTLSDSRPPSDQQATLDFRFGPLSLDWVDYPNPRSPPLSPPLPPSSPTQSTAAGSSNTWLTTSPRPPPAQLKRPRGATMERPPEKSGTTELYWGTVHLYRELGAETEDSNGKEKQSAMDMDDGTVVGMVAVPGNVTAAALLAFISPALDSVMQLRVLRDSTPNRTMVLIRFREAADASEFKVMYNGKPYHDTKDSEVCRVVSISSIKLKSSSTPPFTFPYDPELEPSAKNAVELFVNLHV
ncbi:BRCA1-associated protein, partial [Phenoliferia sp. Uapishka_3]